MRMPSRRAGLTVRAGKRRFVLAGVLLVAGGVPSVTGTVAHGAACQYAAGLGHGWSVLASPPFTAGPTSTNRFKNYPFFMGNGAIFAAVQGNGQTLLATNGTQIMKTTNGGCTWQTTYTFEQGNLGQDPPALAPVSGTEDTSGFTGVYEIQAFAAPRYGGSTHKVYAVIASAGIGTTLVTGEVATAPVTLLVSSNDGSSWQQVSASPSITAPAIPRCYPPVDPYNGPLEMVAAPSNPNTVYLVCGTNGYVGDSSLKRPTGSTDLDLYESTDGGASWVARTVPTSFAFGVPLRGLAVDPKNPAHVWLATNYSTTSSTPNVPTPTLWYSPDAGQHWSKSATGGAVYGRGDPRYPESVALTGEFGVDTSKAGAVTLARGVSGVLRSADNGAHWQTLAPTSQPGVVAAHSVFGPNGDLFVVRDFGVPATYPGPTYCSNTACSWEQLFRVRGSKTTAIPTPGHLISDFYGLQTAGTIKVTVYGYGLLKSAGTGGNGAANSVLLAWTGAP
jgi:hypothetical protein